MKRMYLRQRPSLLSLLLTMLVAAGLLMFAFAATASAKDVTTRAEDPAKIQQGTYSLIAYGCGGANDPKAMAILQKEGIPYTVDIVSPGTHYRVIQGLTAEEAYNRAADFVLCNPNVSDTELTRITAPDGTLIGYEMKPVFMPLRAGSADGVDTHYTLEGNRVLAYVTTDPLFQQDQMGGG